MAAACKLRSFGELGVDSTGLTEFATLTTDAGIQMMGALARRMWYVESVLAHVQAMSGPPTEDHAQWFKLAYRSKEHRKREETVCEDEPEHLNVTSPVTCGRDRTFTNLSSIHEDEVNDASDFQPALSFECARPGYIFRLGGIGLGYYLDLKCEDYMCELNVEEDPRDAELLISMMGLSAHVPNSVVKANNAMRSGWVRQDIPESPLTWPYDRQGGCKAPTEFHLGGSHRRRTLTDATGAAVSCGNSFVSIPPRFILNAYPPTEHEHLCCTIIQAAGRGMQTRLLQAKHTGCIVLWGMSRPRV